MFACVSPRSGDRKGRGFTLLELMVGLAILAILLAIGIPGFGTFIDSSRLRSAGSGLESAVRLARSEAVTRGTSVTLCRKNTANTGCDNGSDWSAGWLVQPNGSEPVRIWETLPNGLTLSVSGAGQSITFTPQGTVDGETVYRFGFSGRENQCFSVTATGAFEARDC